MVEKQAVKIELINDHHQNFKRYSIPKAQLVIADIPYNLGSNAYASSPLWYNDGDNKMLKKEPKEVNQAPAMIVFCAFQQMQMVIDYGKEYGFNKSYPLVFIKKTSSQVLKANQRIVGATEYAIVLYRDKLPKFRNGKTETGKGKMIKNWFEWIVDDKKIYPKIHPTQKPVGLLKELIKVFTDEGDVVIDPVAGSGTTLRAAAELGRKAYGFEIKKDFVKNAREKMLKDIPVQGCLF